MSASPVNNLNQRTDETHEQPNLDVEAVAAPHARLQTERMDTTGALSLPQASSYQFSVLSITEIAGLAISVRLLPLLSNDKKLGPLEKAPAEEGLGLKFGTESSFHEAAMVASNGRQGSGDSSIPQAVQTSRADPADFKVKCFETFVAEIFVRNTSDEAAEVSIRVPSESANQCRMAVSVDPVMHVG